MCLITVKNFGLQEENININRGERPLIRKTGWGTTEKERDRWTERERERGREDVVFYEKGG